MKKAELLRRIEELEARILALESRPIYPVFLPTVPAPIYHPTYPWTPDPTWITTTCEVLPGQSQ